MPPTMTGAAYPGRSRLVGFQPAAIPAAPSAFDAFLSGLQ
jgi:hypothetical protein